MSPPSVMSRRWSRRQSCAHVPQRAARCVLPRRKPSVRGPILRRRDGLCHRSSLVWTRLPATRGCWRVARRVVVFTCDTTDQSWRCRFWLTRDYLRDRALTRRSRHRVGSRNRSPDGAGAHSVGDCAGRLLRGLLAPARGRTWTRTSAAEYRCGHRSGRTREQRAVRSLRDDLASGRWAERHRDLIELDAAELGLRLVIA
jgi:hypothetical protein